MKERERVDVLTPSPLDIAATAGYAATDEARDWDAHGMKGGREVCLRERLGDSTARESRGLIALPRNHGYLLVRFINWGKSRGFF